MKEKFLIFFFLLLSSIAFTQSLNDIFKLLQTKQYTKVFELSNKFKKPLHQVVIYYAIAIIYSDSTYTNYNNFIAYRYANLSSSTYKNLKDSEKKQVLEKFKINASKIEELKTQIASKQFSKSLKNEKEWSQFIETFYDSPFAKKLQDYRDSVYYQNTIKQKSVDAIDIYLNAFPYTKYKQKALDFKDSLIRNEFQIACQQLEYYYILNLQKKYPDFTYENIDQYLYLARQAYDLKLHLGFNSSLINKYKNFIQLAAPHNLAYTTLLTYIKPLLDSQLYKIAIDTIKSFLPFFGTDKKIYELIEILQAPKEKIKISPLPNTINTIGNEYAPVIAADDSTLYFCGKDRPDNIGLEDIFVSKLLPNGQWSPATIVKDLSTPYKNEAPLSITPDGNTMLIFIDGNIYSTTKTKNGWSKPIAIEQINTSYWEGDAFITADGNAIIFSSDRPSEFFPYRPFSYPYNGDIMGNLDLYVILKNSDNSWSKPINLGTKINTPFTERAPYLHNDMKTLYFASDGWTTTGKLDIFVSKRLSDTSWTEWSTPINIGLEYNTPNKETDFKINAYGNMCYFTRRNTSSDIYFAPLKKSIKPQNIIKIQGYVYDKYTNQPLEAQIIWEDLNQNKKIGQLSTDPSTGKYLITLPEGKIYGIYISKNNYYPLSESIDLSNSITSSIYQINFPLIPIDSILTGKEAIELKNIFFDFDDFSLKPTSYAELDRLIDFLNQNPEIYIEISGHTDNVGSEQYNQQLSEKRAKAVYNYLVHKGISTNRLSVKGHGSQKPLLPNDTEYNRSQNRRVEFKVIKK